MAELSVQIQDDPKPGMPFSMIEGMMPMYPMIAFMGWMIVLISFLLGLLVISPAQDDFFSDSMEVRGAAEVGSEIVDANVTIHSFETWVPGFKFVGLGLGLLAINMALGLIAKRLRRMGKMVNAHMQDAHRPVIPPIPARVRMMQMLAMMGMMILIIAFIIALVLAFGTVSDYFDHSIGSELNTAEVGSDLLGDLGTVSAFGHWLAPLRMVGMAFLFTGIIIALTVIIYNLTVQSELLVEYARKSSGSKLTTHVP